MITEQASGTVTESIPMLLKSKDFFVLLCDDSKYNPKYQPMICGVYATKDEAKQANAEIRDCPLKHVMKQCTVQVEFYDKQRHPKGKKAGAKKVQPRKNGRARS